MPTEAQLEREILHLRDKINLICSHYRKLKSQTQLKEEKINKLTQQNDQLKHQLITIISHKESKPRSVERKRQNIMKAMERQKRIQWVTPSKTQSLILERDLIKPQHKHQYNFNTPYLSQRINMREKLRDQKAKFLEEETESVTLRKIWQERDKQISRMNELFEDINKRIAHIQH